MKKEKQNIISFYDMEKKIKSTKINNSKSQLNEIVATCQLSHQQLHRHFGICLNIKSNNTKYISIEYLKHKVFENLSMSDSMKIDILTLVYLGAKIYNQYNNSTLSINDYDIQNMTYNIQLKNNLIIYIYENDAKSKKYFNILKNYKKSIKSIAYKIDTINSYMTQWHKVIDFSNYPPFEKKMKEYKMGLSYNPLSKKDCIIKW